MQRVKTISREVHFEQGPIISTLLVYTIPILLSQLLQQVYNITDCIIVGNFCGDYGLAAVGMCSFIINTAINFFIGFSTGIGVVVSHEFGKYELNNVKRTICSTINLGIILGGLLSVLGMLLAGSFLTWICCPSEMLDITSRYLFICFIGVMPQLVYNICNAILRSLGDTKSSLYYLMISSGINVVLDLIFVIKFKMGLEGAAMATVIAQWILLFIILVRVSRMDKAYSYEFGLSSIKGLALTFSEFRHMLSLSLPSGLQAVFMSISSLVLQVSINSFGYAAIGGMTLYARIEGFLYYPAFAYGIALTGFVGQNIGAKCMERVKKSVRLSMMAAIAIYIPLSLLLTIISPRLIALFTNDANIMANGLEAILWNFPAYVLFIIIQIYLGSLKGMGKTGFPMICSMVCYCIFRIAWCQLLIPVFNSMIVVYTSYDVSWIIMILMLIPYHRRELKIQEKNCIIHN